MNESLRMVMNGLSMSPGWKKMSEKLSAFDNIIEEDHLDPPMLDTFAALKAARMVIIRTLTSSGF